MEDFDNDGLLDIAVTSIDAGAVMGLYRNTGDGKFVECTTQAGLARQLGGLNCGQTDYNNDGMMDIFVPRGAWFNYPVRPSLLRNEGDGTFSDVTADLRPKGELLVMPKQASWRLGAAHEMPGGPDLRAR